MLILKGSNKLLNKIRYCSKIKFFEHLLANSNDRCKCEMGVWSVVGRVESGVRSVGLKEVFRGK